MVKREQGCGIGLSLWLIPEGEERARFATLIDALSRRFDSPRFAPHVTLLGSILTPPATVLQRTQALASQIDPFQISFDRVGWEPAFFRCLFLRSGENPSLTEFNRRAQATLGTGRSRPFRPHLSLVYGRLDDQVRRELGESLAANLPTAFRASVIEVHATEGAPSRWYRVGSFALRRGGFAHGIATHP